jgi:hypothetical protein
MPKVGERFLARRDGKPLRHLAVPEAGNLGKHEPHPVAPLLATAQFLDNARIDRSLRINEPLEVEGICHGAEIAV